MVKNNLAILMARNGKFSAKQISEETGLNKNTISALKYNRARGIQYETLETLCKYFKVEVGEFLRIDKEAS